MHLAQTVTVTVKKVKVLCTRHGQVQAKRKSLKDLAQAVTDGTDKKLTILLHLVQATTVTGKI